MPRTIADHYERLLGWAAAVLTAPPARANRVVSAVWLAVLYLGGVFLWGRFLNWGKGPWMFHDWGDITGPRLTFLRDAVLTGQLPLHTANTAALGGITRRFLAIPDVILSPQVLLLRWLDFGRFSLVHWLLLFSLGYLGLLALRRRLNLSLFAFSLLFFFFNFNGHIISHLSVGHLTWGGYFLYAWFALLALDLLDGAGGWGWIARVAGLLFVMLLQGSYHQFIYALVCLGLLLLIRPRQFWTLAGAAVFSVLLGMARFLPLFSLLGEYKNDYIGGYVNLAHIVNSAVDVQTPGIKLAIDHLTPIPYGLWEMSIYIGLAGLAFLLYFGVVRALRRLAPSGRYTALLVPVLGLTLLSLDKVFRFLRETLPLPVFTGERIANRFLSLALVFVLALAVVEFQRWLDENRSNGLLLVIAIGLALLAVHDLLQNYIVWLLTNASEAFGFYGFTPSQWYVQNDFGDTAYLRLIGIGLGITLLTGAGLLTAARRERRRAQVPVR